jgi:hypothetical protein
MAASEQYCSAADFRSFVQYVITPIRCYLLDSCSVQLDNNWLYSYIEPLINDIQSTPDDKLISHISFFNDILTKLDKPLTIQQNQDLFTVITDGIKLFTNTDTTRICDCGDRHCDGTCGVLSCGCIDSCKCDAYDYWD